MIISLHFTSANYEVSQTKLGLSQLQIISPFHNALNLVPPISEFEKVKPVYAPKDFFEVRKLMMSNLCDFNIKELLD